MTEIPLAPPAVEESNLLNLPYLFESQANAHLIFNELVNRLSMLVGAVSVINRTATTAPSSPSNGDAYIPAAFGGDWANAPGVVNSTLAMYFDGWIYCVPKMGMLVIDLSETNDTRFMYRGATRKWVKFDQIEAAITHLTDNSGGSADNTLQSIPNPADAPASADALRDDLVANVIPALKNNMADLAAKVNQLLIAMEGAGLLYS